MTIGQEIVGILDHDHLAASDSPLDESESQLWRDLAARVFEPDDDGELVREITASYEMTGERRAGRSR
jgi:hypothetical protein